MAKDKEQENFIKYKYALAFKKLLDDNKSKVSQNKEKGVEDLLLSNSYGELSSSTGLRIATISEIFSGLSDVKGSTIDLLLEGMGKSYTEFGKCIENLTKQEVLEYKKAKEKERAEREKKRDKKVKKAKKR